MFKIQYFFDKREFLLLREAIIIEHLVLELDFVVVFQSFRAY